MLKGFLLGDIKNIERDAYIYNSLYGVFNALQAVVVLAVLTRISGLAVAGVFTIAWTIANMMLNIGKFGMRSFHATDITRVYSFNQYYGSRVVSIGLMVITSVLYISAMNLFSDYDFDKTVMVILLTLLKAVDSAEDVIYGEYQRRGRMDVASKCSALRLGITIAVYLGLICASKTLILSTVVTLIFSVVVFFVLIGITFKGIIGTNIKDGIHIKSTDTKSIISLLRACFVIFFSLFLYYLIVNYPKISIDLYMRSEDQSVFGFISMPIFVVDLLSQFLYMPKLKGLTDMVADKDYVGVKRFVRLQLIVTFGLTLLAVIVALTIGAPILSIIYGTDLLPFVNELTILMVGSGFMAYSFFIMNMLIIIRKQKSITISFAITAITIITVCGSWVEKLGLRGASLSYTGNMLVLSICMTILIVRYRKDIFG